MVDLMFEKTFFCFLFSCVRATLFQRGSSFFLISCVRDTLFQPSGSSFFLFSCVRDTLDTLFQPSGSSFFLFSCVKHTLFQPSGSPFFLFSFLYAWNSLRIKVTYTCKFQELGGQVPPLAPLCLRPSFQYKQETYQIKLREKRNKMHYQPYK